MRWRWKAGWISRRWRNQTLSSSLAGHQAVAEQTPPVPQNRAFDELVGLCHDLLDRRRVGDQQVSARADAERHEVAIRLRSASGCPASLDEARADRRAGGGPPGPCRWSSASAVAIQASPDDIERLDSASSTIRRTGFDQEDKRLGENRRAARGLRWRSAVLLPLTARYRYRRRRHCRFAAAATAAVRVVRRARGRSGSCSGGGARRRGAGELAIVGAEAADLEAADRGLDAVERAVDVAYLPSASELYWAAPMRNARRPSARLRRRPGRRTACLARTHADREMRVPGVQFLISNVTPTSPTGYWKLMIEMTGLL